MDDVIEVESAGEVTVVTFLDRIITEDRIAPIRSAVTGVLESGRTNLVFDLSHVQYLSSALLAIFIMAKKWKPSGSGAATPPREVTSLGEGSAGPRGPIFRSRIFEIYPDRPSAIASLVESGPDHGWIALCCVATDLVEVFRIC